MKTYNGPYGHTYFYLGADLVAVPTNADGSFDDSEEARIYVADFVEPLTDDEMNEVVGGLKDTSCPFCKKAMTETANVNECLPCGYWEEVSV